ncbi:MAG: S8 family serine peptidase [Actinomycetota bacterium]|nr:S8 family serine peptidase [Actinomycetota bacterium]
MKRHQTGISYIVLLSFLAMLLLALVGLDAKAQGLSLSRAPLAGSALTSAAGEIIVKFIPGLTRQKREGLNKAIGARSKGFIEELGIELVESVDASLAEELVLAYRSSGLVEFAESNGFRQAARVPNDPRFHEQWNLNLIGAPLAWDISTGSSEVVVAVIDTGIDLHHPDLAANIWQNSDEIPANGLDDDNNGFIDDSYGWNFVDGNNSVADDDSNGHGSHVAGIIAAVSDNALGIASLAQKCPVMPIKGLNRQGYGDDYKIAKAITYAVDNGADIINISFGGSSRSEALLRAVEYARRKDVVVVAAAGNDAQAEVIYPAAFPYVIAVSATDVHDNIAPYSNYGDAVDLAAPGGDSRRPILSTSRSASYTYGMGTSLATPHVAALAALIRSAHPALKANEVERALESSALDRGDYGWDRYYGFGRIDAAKALISPLIISDPYEPNDTFATAYPISFGRLKAKMAKYADDFDTYSFTVSDPPKELSIILSNIPEASNYEVKLYDYLHRPLNVSNGQGAKERIDYRAVSSGTYYISISARRGSGSDDKDYLLSLMLEGQTFKFNDLSYFHWSFEDVSYLSAQALISGYPDGSFRPTNPVSRAEFASLICKIRGWDRTGPKEPSFPDVFASHWAYLDIEAAKSHGVISGYEDGSFRPDGPATRAEISSMIFALNNLAPGTSGPSFLDVPVAHWAYSPIMTCRNNGLIYGYQGGAFRPRARASRAEVSAILARLLRSYAS